MLLSNDTAAKAGIYLTNGNQRVTARLFANDTHISFQLDTAVRTIPNTAGNIVWLKLQRNSHALTGYYSRDGKNWIILGAPISAVNLDKAQPGFNSWVGASLGLFAEGRPADFDFFTCKDAFSPLTAAGYANEYGITTHTDAGEKIVTNTSNNGGWLMISGVETGSREPTSIELTATAKTTGNLEIWLDDLQHGKLLTTVPIQPNGVNGQWKTFVQPVERFKGHHDIFIKYPAGEPGAIMIRSLQFTR